SWADSRPPAPSGLARPAQPRRPVGVDRFAAGRYAAASRSPVAGPAGPPILREAGSPAHFRRGFTMRRRRTVLVSLTLLVGTVCAAVGSVGYAVKREPDFYARSPCPADWDTREKAARLVTRVQDLKNDIQSK